jgi:hypothetical protein
MHFLFRRSGICIAECPWTKPSVRPNCSPRWLRRIGKRMKTNSHPVDEESSIRYAGWGVLAAAFTGVMVRFAPIVPYTFSLFLDPLHAAFGWKRKAMGGVFALSRHYGRICFTSDRHFARPLSAAPYYPPRDSGFRRRACRTQPADAAYRSVLCHVVCNRVGGQCYRAICVHAHDSYLVHNPQRNGTRIVAHWKWPWLHPDSAAHRVDDPASRVAQRVSPFGRHRDSRLSSHGFAGTQPPGGYDRSL